MDLGSPSAKMAETVVKIWPAGVVATVNHPGVWGYEEGVLLDGMAAEWHSTAVGADFKYIKAAVDKYVADDGTIKTFGAEAHSLDNAVVNNTWSQGTVMIPANTGVFAHPHQAYLKEICTITISGAAKAVVTDKGDVLMAVSTVGKGTVFAVADPWIYNEYVDRRNALPLEFDGYDAAIDLAGWAVQRAR